MSLEIGIPPQYLIDLDARMFEDLLMGFKDRAKEQKDAYSGNKRQQRSRRS
jgi:hypothetical protein